MLTLKTIIFKLIDILFIFAPNIGYIHQYLKINKMKDSTGFSKFISFILIIAYNLRFFFYIGEKFVITILYQAIICFIMQIMLLKICVKYDHTLKNRKNENYFSLNQFWNWPYLIDYIFFISLFSSFMSFISNFFTYQNKTYIYILGILTSMLEALLDIPQIIDELKINKNDEIENDNDNFSYDECQVCYEEINKEEKNFNQIPCGHLFCTHCWQNYLRTLITEAKVEKIKCM